MHPTDRARKQLILPLIKPSPWSIGLSFGCSATDYVYVVAA
jgi:hypothetical protein